MDEQRCSHCGQPGKEGNSIMRHGRHYEVDDCVTALTEANAKLQEIADVAQTIVDSAGPVDKVSAPMVRVPRHDLAYLKQLLRQHKV